MTENSNILPPSFNDDVIAKIIFGNPLSENIYDFDSVSSHMFNSIKNLTRQIIYLNSVTDMVAFSLLGPFLGRSLLEVCLYAIVGRIDPYRLLVIRHQQTHDNYNRGTRNLAALQWTGDIISDKPNNELLDLKKKYQDLSRALLSDHYDILLWQPAVTRTLDAITRIGVEGSWIEEIRKHQPDGFIAAQRSKLTNLYSQLSKGIHHEFVIPPGDLYDKPTVACILGDSIQSCCILGVIANFIGHISRPISEPEIKEKFELLNMAASFEIN